jgi:hypothetical protein
MPSANPVRCTPARLFCTKMPKPMRGMAKNSRVDARKMISDTAEVPRKNLPPTMRRDDSTRATSTARRVGRRCA